MKKIILTLVSLGLVGSFSALNAGGVVITPENFIHADSARAYKKELAQTGGKVNTLRSLKVMANTDNQDVIRMNSDTLYTRVILDVKGGASITTKAYDGFQNIQILDPFHSEIKTMMGAGTLKINEKELTEGHHAYVLIRTGLIRSLPEKEMYAAAYKAQENISITYKSSTPYVPAVKYDFTTLDKVKYKILTDFVKHPKKDTVKNGFGLKAERDPVSARTVVAVGWGGLSGKNAVYSAFVANGERRSITLTKPDLNYKEHGFFSFTIYNAMGYISTMNYAINSDDMVANKDGSYTVNFLASGEPKKGLTNVVRTPRGKIWTGVFRCYYPNNTNETFKFADALTAKMNKEFIK